MISHWFGWLALGFCIVLMLKFAARKSHISSLNVFFRKLHIPIGVMLIVTGLLHGIIELIKIPSHITVVITGIGAMVLILFITATYILRKKL